MNPIYRIGKNPKNDLVLNERTADEFHATLSLTDSNELIVSDLNTKYGTVVSNGKVKSCSLQPEDKLQIGFTTVDWQAIKAYLITSRNNNQTLQSLETTEHKSGEEPQETLTRAFNEPVISAESGNSGQEHTSKNEEVAAVAPQTDDAGNQKQDDEKNGQGQNTFTPKVIVVNTTSESANQQAKPIKSEQQLYVLLIVVLAGMMLLGWCIGKFMEL
jgi:pSer/pThr/pTyr-binding forkhead associated (FHA) protein